MIIESEPFSLSDILSPVFAEADAKIKQKGLSFSVAQKNLPLALKGDGKKLATIFFHLLDKIMGAELTVESEPGHGSAFSFIVRFGKIAGSSVDRVPFSFATDDHRRDASEIAGMTMDDIDFQGLFPQLMALEDLLKKIDDFDFKGALQELAALQRFLQTIDKEREKHG